MKSKKKRKKIEILKSNNLELVQQINYAQKQYDDINEKLQKRSNTIEEQNELNDKINNLDRDIAHTNSELDHYKKLIDNLKNKLDFKLNLERSINLENLIKAEMNKNKELRKEHESLSKLNMGQIKALNTYDRETKFNEKIDILKNEIKTIKDSLKESVENYLKQERYIKHIHENIAWVEKKK